jgi:ubiquinone/menaquinone biosynthesis C-methylase UbiE
LKDAEKFNEGGFQEKQKNAWSESASLRQRVRENRLLALVNLLRIKFSFSGRRDRLFYDEMAHGDKSRLILDLGCGGGRHYFCDYGQVVGIDPELALLPLAKKLYAEVYHAGGYQIPFADNTFDNVVSSDVLGHIPFDKKDVIFNEMYRVLKPGGRTVHMIETDAINIWTLQAKKIPGFFEKYFVDMPGHFGLELPTALRARFLKHGFKEIRFKKISSNLQPLGGIEVIFKHDFDKHPAWLRAIVRLDGLLGRNLAVREALQFLMEPVVMLDDALTSIDHCTGMLVVFEK